MLRISASKFQREFGRLRRVANREAVIVTSHCRDDVVLLSAEEYRRLRSLCAARMGTEDSIARRVKSERCSSRSISKMSNVMRSILLILNANSARSPWTPLAARERSFSLFMEGG